MLLQGEIARLDKLRLDPFLVRADAAAHKPTARYGVYELLRRRIDNLVIKVLARSLRLQVETGSKAKHAGMKWVVVVKQVVKPVVKHR